jgi:hypothetical protein
MDILFLIPIIIIGIVIFYAISSGAGMSFLNASAYVGARKQDHEEEVEAVLASMED